jgi:FtsH-binding integral membrane protein
MEQEANVVGIEAEGADIGRRPEKVAFAMRALYVTLGLGVVRAIIRFVEHAAVRSFGLGEIVTLILFGLSLLFIVRVGEGRSWARVALLVILIGAIPLTILPFFQTIFHNPIPTALGLVQVVFFTTAMVLLYDRNVSAWFRSAGNGQ